MKKLFCLSTIFPVLMFAGLIDVIADSLSIHLSIRSILFSIMSGVSFSFCLGLYRFLEMVTGNRPNTKGE